MANERERFQRLREVFAAVSELPLSERAAAVNEQCQGDAELWAEVESMLSLLDDATPPLDTAGGLREVRACARQPDEWIGKRIGAFEIDAVLGQGGMGTVFAAHRVGDPFEQRVAVKIVTHHVFDQDAHVRFARERAILARLEHPNIARFIDGGATESDIPYFIMELVDGDPIDRWCEQRQLDVPSRLQLVLQLCAALQHAHGRLVLHRDIKPSNVLINTNGQLKLLDFGVARVLDLVSSSSTVTRDGLAPLTPEYAAPEQFSGGELSVSTDVYQVGILLYRLLTGRLPFRKDGMPFGMLLHAVMEEVPASPSTSASDALPTDGRRTLRQQLSGDLDDIVLMALRKEPAARYASVAHLAEDIQRWLDGQPVHAHGKALPYRVRKFLRRNRAAVALGVVALATAGAGIAATAVQGARARHSAEVAMRQEAKASAVNQFLQNMLASADPFRMGGEISVRAALDRAAAAADTAFLDDPETREAILSTIGRTYLTLGLTEESRTFLDSAIAINNRLGNRTTRDAFLASGARIAIDLSDGRFGEMRARADSLLPGYRAVLGPRDSIVAALVVVQTMARFGSGDLAGATVTLDSLLPISREAFGDTAKFVLTTQLLLANLLALQGQRTDEALSLVRSSLDGVAGRGPFDPAYLELRNLAIEALSRLGKGDEARQMARDQLTMVENGWGAGTAATLMARRLLALGFFESRRTDTALIIMRGVIDDAAKTLTEANPRRVALEQEYGSLLIALGRAREAEPLLRRVHAFHLARDGEASSRTLNAYRGIASAVRLQGRSSEALEMLEGVLETQERTAQLGPAYFTTVVEVATSIQQSQGTPAAVERLARYIAPARKNLAQGDRTLNQLLVTHAQLLTASGKFTDAEAMLQEVHSNYLTARDGDSAHPDVQWAEERLQAFYQATGQERKKARPPTL